VRDGLPALPQSGLDDAGGVQREESNGMRGRMNHGELAETRWGPTSCWWAKYLRDARYREQGRRRAAKSYLNRQRKERLSGREIMSVV
jgi:hypothetical protein